MKTYLSKTRLVTLALATVLSTSLTTPLFAKNDGDNKTEVTYVGNINNLPVYRLSLKNEEKETFYITVSDNDGNEIYNEKLTGVNIVRNYQLATDIDAEYNLTFKVENAKRITVSIYNVTNKKKIINEVAVNKIR